MGKVVGVTPVPTSLIPAALPKVADKLTAVYEKTHMWLPRETMVENLLEGKMQLWLLTDEAGVAATFCTRLYSQYGLKLMEIVLYSGSWPEGVEGALVEVEAWGREAGAEAVRMEGRDGWRKRLQNLGYSFEHTAMFKLLKDDVS